MAEWPSNLVVGPIREWPGALTPQHKRQVSKFRVRGEGWSRRATPLSDTTALLSREMSALKARNGEMLIAMRPEDFRIDGYPRATAKAEHPGVILSFDSTVGHLSYPCDTFTTWQDNLRAIALALEALRKVDRYGVTKHGEQYRGFLPIEAARPMGSYTGTAQAFQTLKAIVGIAYDEEIALSDLIRRAQRVAHPDTGDKPDRWNDVQEASEYLRRHLGEGR